MSENSQDNSGSACQGPAMKNDQDIYNDYVVGAEKSLPDVMKGSDIAPLLNSAVNAGASLAAVINDRGDILYQSGMSRDRGFVLKKPLHLEGETAGYIILQGPDGRAGLLNAVGEILYDAVTAVLKSSFRAMLATETHYSIVHRSYEELLETNRKLAVSEGRYRELAGSLDIQVQERTKELKQAHTKLLQQEKIASVGQLAAGIAHEINNPLGFITSNIRSMGNYISKCREQLTLFRTTLDKDNLSENDRAALKKSWKALKIDYVLADAGDLIRESLEGAERVRKIIVDLKGFSHIDEASESDADINAEIERTLNVLIHEIPGNAEIIKNYSDLPLFSCNPARLCQAFFNIILNAVQARRDGLKLTITTGCTDKIRISFSDNGPGMEDRIVSRIFEPFFTTKEVGTGTGMGLNVTYEAITSYGGTIEVESEPGKGTTFTVLLPAAGRS